MKHVLDLHTHTLASGHAYNTIREMACSAADKGLELLGITEHAPQLPGTCHDFYFSNLKVVSRKMCGIELMLGAELNILDYNGSVDLAEGLLKQMDIAIASMHMPCIKPGTAEQNTAAYINVMKNPYVDIIGHPDDNRYPVDMESLVKASKEYGVLLELNNSSLNPAGARKNSKNNDIELLKYCKQYGVSIIIGSDAHTESDVGRYDLVMPLIKEVDFPEELIINRDVSELKKYLRKYKA